MYFYPYLGRALIFSTLITKAQQKMFSALPMSEGCLLFRQWMLDGLFQCSPQAFSALDHFPGTLASRIRECAKVAITDHFRGGGLRNSHLFSSFHRVWVSRVVASSGLVSSEAFLGLKMVTFSLCPLLWCLFSYKHTSPMFMTQFHLNYCLKCPIYHSHSYVSS